MKSSKQVSIAGRIAPRMPIALPVLMIAVIALVVAGSVTVFGSAFTVNKLNDMIIDEAREEARASANSACDGISKFVIARPDLTLEQIAADPEVRKKLVEITNCQNVVLAEIRDSEGRVLARERCQESCKVQPAVAWRESNAPIVHLADDEPATRDAIIPISFPLQRDGVEIGQIQLGFSRQVALNRIEFLASQVSSSMTQMVIVVMAILLMTLLLVYLTFLRQIELLRHASESQQMANMGALAAGLAHEIRNPLHAMNLHLDVAREDIMERRADADSSETISSIDRVQGQLRRLNDIVSNFLSLALPNQITFEQTRVDQLVREVVELLKPEFQSADIAIRMDVPDLSIRVDPRAMHQVILNIMLNACQILSKNAGPREIAISWSDEKKWRGLVIEDSGPGITPGEEEEIFAGFVSKRCGGTGFGLSIARRIVEAHKGKIYAERSEKLGGAKFVIQLPKE